MKKFVLFFSVLLAYILCFHISSDLHYVFAFDDWAADVSDSWMDESTGVVYMGGEFLDGDLLRISVFVKDFQQPVLGAAFDLLFAVDDLFFLKYEPGDFLDRGGDPFYLVSETGQGRVLFGGTLRKDDSFPLGSGKLVDLYFQIINDGAFDFVFENGIVSTVDVIRQDLNNIEWKGLSLDRDSQNAYLNNMPGFSDTDLFFGSSSLSKLMPYIVVFAAIISSFFLIRLVRVMSRGSVNFK